jgi:hypothetical protein
MGAGCFYAAQPSGIQPQLQPYHIRGCGQVTLAPQNDQQQPQYQQQQQHQPQYQQQYQQQPQYQQQQQPQFQHQKQPQQFREDPQRQQNAQLQNQPQFHEAVMSWGDDGGYYIDGKYHWNGGLKLSKNIWRQHQQQVNMQSQHDQQTKGYQTAGDSIFKKIRWGVMR